MPRGPEAIVKIIARLFLAFTVISIVELYLLLQVARITNWWVTIALVILPGIGGAWLARREGTRAIGEIGRAIQLQREPAGAIMDGVIVLVASALLIAPGVLTDLTGLALLIPPVRVAVGGWARKRIRRMIDDRLASGSLAVHTGGSSVFDGFGAGSDYEVIDAEDIPKPR